jgi:hypothetical protein
MDLIRVMAAARRAVRFHIHDRVPIAWLTIPQLTLNSELELYHANST